LVARGFEGPAEHLRQLGVVLGGILEAFHHGAGFVLFAGLAEFHHASDGTLEAFRVTWLAGFLAWAGRSGRRAVRALRLEWRDHQADGEQRQDGGAFCGCLHGHGGWLKWRAAIGAAQRDKPGAGRRVVLNC
jgi:hypothetical protein